jgi:hypothetical protein
VRSALVCSIGVIAVAAACATTPTGGTLSEGAVAQPKIVAVDSAVPPRTIMVQMPQAGYATVVLVAVGHSATLLYPPDSTTSNQLGAGSHSLSFSIPSVYAQSDSERIANARDTVRLRQRSRATRIRGPMPLPPNTVAYLLLITSPQPLVYERLIDKTAGVSIPNIDSEALNAIAKAVKATLPAEPREWAGHYLPIELRRSR